MFAAAGDRHSYHLLRTHCGIRLAPPAVLRFDYSRAERHPVLGPGRAKAGGGKGRRQAERRRRGKALEEKAAAATAAAADWHGVAAYGRSATWRRVMAFGHTISPNGSKGRQRRQATGLLDAPRNIAYRRASFL